MSKTRLILYATLIILMQPVFSTFVVAQNEQFFIDHSTTGLPGRLYVPPEAANGPRPVIVFLHGGGARGTDNISQVNGSIQNLLLQAASRGAFLYAPQIPVGNWHAPALTDTVIAMTDQIIRQQNADPNRIYVTGLSLGGGGTWTVASRYPSRFAAAVPIAGGNSPDFQPTYILDVPTWAFHARDDDVVTVSRSRDRVNQMVAATNQPAVTYPLAGDPNIFNYFNEDIPLRYTELPAGGHSIWGSVYADPTMNEWMFSQAVPEPEFGAFFLVACLCMTGIRAPTNSRKV